jgi:hypothetical protein
LLYFQNLVGALSWVKTPTSSKSSGVRIRPKSIKVVDNKVSKVLHLCLTSGHKKKRWRVDSVDPPTDWACSFTDFPNSPTAISIETMLQKSPYNCYSVPKKKQTVWNNLDRKKSLHIIALSENKDVQRTSFLGSWAAAQTSLQLWS